MERTFRPAAYPLITVDPFFSIWSTTERLDGSYTTHWTGRPAPIFMSIKTDKAEYTLAASNKFHSHLISENSRITFTNLKVTPLSTVYEFENEEFKATVTFTTPLLLDRIDIFSRPVSYVAYDIQSKNGQPVQFTFGISPEICVDDYNNRVKAERPGNSVACGNVKQDVLAYSGDGVLINWGKLYIADKNGMLMTFSRNIHTPVDFDGEFDPYVSAYYLGCERKESKGVITVGYDEIKPIEYFGEKLDEYYKKDFSSFEQMLSAADAQYDEIKAMCDKFDKELTDEAQKLGEDYKNIVTIAYRQAIAAHKLVPDKNGNVLFLSKECFSNGCIGTLDVTYPSIPLFLKYNPELVLGMLRPIIRQAKEPDWEYDFAPHDVGRYPLANGQVYGRCDGKLMLEKQMPVEESGNMLLCVAAVSMYSEIGKKFFEENKEILKKWADYLLEYGYDPGNQLCTDDFAGHLNHNCNLSIKAILGIYAYGDLSGEDVYKEKAREFAAIWEKDASNGKATRLAFDKEDSWSLKYNIVWDKLLGYNIFSDTVKKKEIELYKTKLNRYGVPLDSRKDYTKLDWLMWSTKIYDDKEYFDAVCKSIVNMICETGDRVPLTDWYCTKSAVFRSFVNRTVVGGLFINLI